MRLDCVNRWRSVRVECNGTASIADREASALDRDDSPIDIAWMLAGKLAQWKERLVFSPGAVSLGAVNTMAFNGDFPQTAVQTLFLESFMGI